MLVAIILEEHPTTTPVLFFIEGLNPEPWSAPMVQRRQSFKSERLINYQAGLRTEIAAEMESRGLERFTAETAPFGVCLNLQFWRDTEHGNVADLTNLIKSTEDALQPGPDGEGGVVDNDRLVVALSGRIIKQEKGALPGVHIIAWASSQPLEPLGNLEPRERNPSSEDVKDGLVWDVEFDF